MDREFHHNCITSAAEAALFHDLHGTAEAVPHKDHAIVLIFTFLPYSQPNQKFGCPFKKK
jgi:hypothetical protein